MQDMWISLNMSCKNKMNDVKSKPQKVVKQRSQNADEEEHSVHVRSKILEGMISYRQTGPSSSFKEIGIEDPSRKVIEKILQDALRNPTKKSLKIRKVFRVKNSPEVTEKFEMYRDMVKQKAKATEHKHPRSLVDGNEFLCFYVTTVSCQSKQPEPISGPCENFECNLCRIISYSFDIKHTKRHGIQLSISCEALSQSIAAVSKGKNSRKAIIICRIIAGRIRSTKDCTSGDEYDSIRNYRGFCFNSEHLIVKNPNAVLPCFVIVLS